jgi:hypothetical protein
MAACSANSATRAIERAPTSVPISCSTTRSGGRPPIGLRKRPRVNYGVYKLYAAGLSKRAIAAQMGWSEAGVTDLLRTFGHADVVALAEVDALYSDAKTGGTDADSYAHPPEAAF